MYYVYILKSLKDKRLYIGYTNDLKRRFNEHNEGMSKATKFRRPLALVYYESFSSSKDARKREVELKKFKGGYSQLKKRIKNSLDIE